MFGRFVIRFEPTEGSSIADSPGRCGSSKCGDRNCPGEHNVTGAGAANARVCGSAATRREVLARPVADTVGLAAGITAWFIKRRLLLGRRTGAGAESARAFGSAAIQRKAGVRRVADTAGLAAGITRWPTNPAPARPTGAGAAIARACGSPTTQHKAGVRRAARTRAPAAETITWSK